MVRKYCAVLCRSRELATGRGPCSEETWMLQVPSHPAVHWGRRRRRRRDRRAGREPGRFFLQ